jgi:hypothetical protein
MRNTRYYEKKMDDATERACFWSSAKKGTLLDSDPTLVTRSWVMKGAPGTSIGYKSEGDMIQGLIESAFYSQGFNGETFLNIGFQSELGVEVLKTVIKDQANQMPDDGFDLANILAGINLNKEVLLQLKPGRSYKSKHRGTVTPWKVEFSQLEGATPRWVSWTFPWVKGASYFTGLEMPTWSMVMGNNTKDSAARDKLMWQEVETFIGRVEVECAGRQEARPLTPSEAALPNSSPVEDEILEEDCVPF